MLFLKTKLDALEKLGQGQLLKKLLSKYAGNIIVKILENMVRNLESFYTQIAL